MNLDTGEGPSWKDRADQLNTSLIDNSLVLFNPFKYKMAASITYMCTTTSDH